MSQRFQLVMTNEKTGVARVLRHIKIEEAERLLGQGKINPVMDSDGGLIIGFEVRTRVCRRAAAVVHPKIKQVLEARSAQSCTAFSRAEVEAIVGMRGESKTARLNEDQKAERIRRRWCGEDIVESARKKLEVYPSVH